MESRGDELHPVVSRCQHGKMAFTRYLSTENSPPLLAWISDSESRGRGPGKEIRGGSHAIPECGLGQATSDPSKSSRQRRCGSRFWFQGAGAASDGGSRLKLGVGMDTVASLTPPRRPSSSAGKLLGTSSRTAAASPRPLLKLKQRRSISCSNSLAAAAARPRSSWSCASASASSAAAAAEPPQKEKDLVFVAGATGRVGSRAVRELVKLGFRVRAAVRNVQRASSLSLVQGVQQLKLDGDAAAIPPAEKLEIVECDLEKQPQDGIVKAIGNASLVVCSIGASEKEILDVTGPYRIDYMATRNLVEAGTYVITWMHHVPLEEVIE
ncbi:hypothetical protein HU200_037362 [Digitaria exilis]|uniref:NmrA-like domain-containing protein n=1 Tax=Digitaria exilis TaxID=1010633 RepID=A0A835BEQ4_9POAL|nr:hypothetical protein HU200_037362 [Digitaria exilis]